MPLLDDGSLHSEELRLSSSGPSRVWEIPESNCDSNSERLQSLSKGGAEARLRREDSGLACKDGKGSSEGSVPLASMSEHREQDRGEQKLLDGGPTAMYYHGQKAPRSPETQSCKETSRTSPTEGHCKNNDFTKTEKSNYMMLPPTRGTV